MVNNWKSFFNGFSLYKTSIIQENYIENIKKYTPKNGNILETACGSGLTSVLLADMGYNVTCTDIDVDLIENIKKKFCSIENLRIEKSDLFNIDQQYKEKSYNSIVHQGVLEHFEDEQIVEILSKQKNVSNFIIFDIPNDKRKIKFQEFGNERFLSIDHWKNLIQQSGCHIFNVDGRRFEENIEKIKSTLSKEERVELGTSTTFVVKSTSSISKKLHYGCGTVYLKDWFNVDGKCDYVSSDLHAVKFLDENATTKENYYQYNFSEIDRSKKKTIVDFEGTIRDLSAVFSSYFEEIILYHVFEHIPLYEIDEFLSRLKNISKKNATFYFAVPDNLEIAKFYVNADSEEKRNLYHSWIYGKQRDKFSHHYVGYDKDSFLNKLNEHFVDIKFEKNMNDYPAIWVTCSGVK